MTNYSKLQDEQLLEYLIPEHAVKEITATYGGIREGLLYSSKQELEGIRGIGVVKAKQLHCITELAKRLCHTILPKPEQIQGVGDVYQYFQDLQNAEVEEFHVLYLNTKNRILGSDCISKGSINASFVTGREVFCRAVRMRAAGIIVAHNHPSGIAEPSQDDIEITKKLIASGKLLDIMVIDHIIIGKGQYISFVKEGLI